MRRQRPATSRYAAGALTLVGLLIQRILLARGSFAFAADQEPCVAVYISLQIVTSTCAHISSLSKSVHLNAHADQLKLATLSKVLVYDVLDATGREPACSHMGLRGQARPTQARIISILSSA